MKVLFEPLDAANRPQWQAFVETQPHAWLGHRLDLLDFETRLGRSGPSFLMRDGNKELIGVCPLFRSHRLRARRIPFVTLSTGATFRGGPLLAANLSPRNRRHVWSAIAEHLEALATAERADMIHVALPHVRGKQLTCEAEPYLPLRPSGYRGGDQFSLVLPLHHRPHEVHGQLDSDTRRLVRNCEDADVVVSRVRTREDWLAGDPLNRDTFQDPSEPPYPPEFFEAAWTHLFEPGHAHAFAAHYEGELAAMIAVAGTGDSLYYWLSFNRRPRPMPGINAFLLWKIIDWACRRNVSFFELGSLEFDDPRQQAIARFKQGFGGRVAPSLEGTRVCSEVKTALADGIEALVRRLRSKKSGGD